jgi:dTDP-glucose 4,6-dehydratase
MIRSRAELIGASGVSVAASSMHTLLITGGAGFIGSNLVHHVLAHTTARVVVVDKMTYAANPLSLDTWRSNTRVSFVQADIVDRGAMTEIVASHQPSAILNLAAETHVDRSIDSPQAFIDTNVTGTFVLLDVARHHVATERESDRAAFRFLHVSTDEVYGSLGDEGLFSETTPYAPNSPYSASKAGADHLVRAYFHTYGLQTLITNCSNNYGPFQHPEKLIPLTILNALEGRTLPIYGDGRNVRDWLHVEDHCAGILTVLQGGRPGEHYNIGASNEQPNIAIVDLICDVLEELQPAASNPALRAAGVARYTDLKRFVADRPGHDRRYAVDAAKVRAELGWRAEQAFRDGLRATAQWYLDHQDWCRATAGGYDRQRLGLGAGRV